VDQVFLDNDSAIQTVGLARRNIHIIV
jgi:hypothetical protein